MFQIIRLFLCETQKQIFRVIFADLDNNLVQKDIEML